VAAFATVLSGVEADLPAVHQAVVNGWTGQGFEWNGPEAKYIDPAARRPDGGEGTAIPPVAIRLVGGTVVEAYTSHQRPVPFFFCGAIMAEDWRRLGGYPEGLAHGASDLHLAFKMVRRGMRFRFLGGAIAYHIAHDKR
jgi:GT2 family glycosyltransferase